MSEIISNNMQSKRIVILAGFGAVLEVYDYIIYVIFAKQILATFFSNIENEAVKAFIVVAIFSITYIVRPFGAILLGTLGDRYGRKKIFTFTIVLMGIASFAMGIMPGYETLGLFASLSFLLFRILQGFALSGELPAAYVIVYESVSNKIGFRLSILFAFVLSGFLLATTVCSILEFIFGEYAWRASYILGGGLAFFGFYLRLKLNETPLFKKISSEKRKPLFELFKYNALGILTGFCFAMLFATGAIILLQYSNFFISKILDKDSVTSIMIPVQILVLFAVIFFGYFSDKIGLLKTYTIGCIGLLIFVGPLFSIMNSFNTVLIGMMLLIILYAFGASVTLFFLCDIFPTEFRLSGVALSYSINSAFVGGVCPLLSNHIIENSGVLWLGPTTISMLCLAFGLLAILLYKKVGGHFKERENANIKL
ncbi:MFS transporter [Francisella frigiditurris]|uniref:Sugar (And other) transporter family protein n=1 Tax=Francisella frigiditurris TaxID=1542390 RepID=A0A1J0KT27_9GAMM|nr:MFS transporter [Francisella frigiditurris]APC96851.1 sugar (and other) transporter family protein [Francisella frigiditurris]